jgi:AcrR family transcriptional regulator
MPSPAQTPPTAFETWGAPPDAGTGTPPPSTTAVDGRQLRRERNREAVVEALLDLYADGRLRPSSDEIATRSGLSPRSIFRYFDDIDDLIRAAVTRQQARVIPLVPIEAGPDAPLAERITALVDQRYRLFETVGNAAAVVRLRSPFEPVLSDALRRHRQFLRSQVATLFATELAALGETAGTTLAAADVLTSYESRHLMVDDQQLEPDQAREATVDALTALFAGH